MNRVVVTGLGIVSCIGNNQSDVIDSLKNLKSGITSAKEYEEFSFRSLVHGKPNIDISNEIDRRLLRFMGDGAPSPINLSNLLSISLLISIFGLPCTRLLKENSSYSFALVIPDFKFLRLSITSD